MTVHDYLIDPAELDWNRLLTEWQWLLPDAFTVWLVNRFGDIFLVFEDGSVHMLDIGQGELLELADDRERFCDLIDEEDNAVEWLMVPLVDACMEAGLEPGPGQCYSYDQPPVLGGEYSVANTRLSDLGDHYGLFGQLHRQTHHLPDGAQIEIGGG